MGDQEQLIPPTQQIPVNIEDEMRKSYLDYAMSVIIGRALPEVRDGLKPVHRRILYAMYKEGNTSDKRYVKCAAVVGEVIKKYHPHGDTALYDTLVRMAQDFNMRYPLIDGQGNFGSVDGDPAAAYRYTECRLTRLAEELLADIEKDTVDFVPNFDESTEEPTVLPTKVPNLLINGSDGIAVGMATKIPPHNLTEIIDATILLINKPGATSDEVLSVVPGPDFPTGAYLYGKSGIKAAYETGRGQFTMRAKAAIERPAKEKQQIVITHILEGFMKALSQLDATIKLIRGSKEPKEARAGLMTRFDFTERQAQAILELQLQRLTALERDKIQHEYDDLQKKIAGYKEILASEKVLKKVIVDELKQVQKEYGDARKTEIIEEQAEIKLEDLIADEDAVITVSHSGYLKRTPLTAYRQQGRGGKGRLGMKTREEDFVEHLFIASTHSYILVLTHTGKLHWLKVYEIPDVGAAGRGKHILNLVNLASGEKVAAVMVVKELPDERKDVTVDGETYAAEGYVVLVTRQGVIKKTRLAEFSNPRSAGIVAMKIEEGDELIAGKLTTGRDTIFLATHEGMAIRFPESDVRDLGRPAYGVNAMDLEEGDYIVGMEIVGGEELILSVTEKGFGKRTPIAEYRVQSRAGKGVINVKTTERNGKVVGVLSVTEDSEVMLISQQGKIARLDAGKIRESGRSAQGVTRRS